MSGFDLSFIAILSLQNFFCFSGSQKFILVRVICCHNFFFRKNVYLRFRGIIISCPSLKLASPFKISSNLSTATVIRSVGIVVHRFAPYVSISACLSALALKLTDLNWSIFFLIVFTHLLYEVVQWDLFYCFSESPF